MPETIRPDICVIGTGAGGLQVAVQAAAFGVRVVLVDPDAGPGGQSGGLPLSARTAAARRAHAAAQSPVFGVLVKSMRADFRRVLEHVQGVLRSRAPNRSNRKCWVKADDCISKNLIAKEVPNDEVLQALSLHHRVRRSEQA